MLNKKKISWWRVNFGSAPGKYISASIKRKKISQGTVTEQFENEIAKKLRTKYCVLTNNGSIALLMSLFAIGIKSGDEVILQNRAWVSSFNALLMIGAKIRLLDVSSKGQYFCEKELEKKITKKTKALIVTHMNGNTFRLELLNKFKKKFPSLKIIEDSSQAFMSKYKNKFLGNFGDIGCFSLSMAKFISTGQGGVIITKNKKYYKFLKKFRSHSMNSNLETKFVKFGFNFRFNDIQASFGLSQIKLIKSKISKFNKIYYLYEKGFKNLKKISLIKKSNKDIIPLYIEVLVKNRNKFRNFLLKKNIETREFYNSLSSIQYAKEKTIKNLRELNNSRIYENRGVYLPCGPDQSIKDINYVINIVKEYDSK